MSSVLSLNRLHAIDKGTQRRVPAHCQQPTSVVPQQRLYGALWRVEHGKRFPALRASHSEIDRIIASGRQTDSAVVAQMNVETAPRRAEAANRLQDAIRLTFIRQ